MIIECAAAWRATLPECAVLSRYGGDHFLLILPDTSLGRAADITDGLRAAAVTAGLTVSAGVAAWQYGDSRSVLLNRADVALYDAKTSGRDRTVVYGDPGREASRSLGGTVAFGPLPGHRRMGGVVMRRGRRHAPNGTPMPRRLSRARSPGRR